MNQITIGDMLTDAIRYWEPRRIGYNAILVVVVVTVFVLHWPESRSVISVDLLLRFFILAVLANVAYCSAYVVDIAVQLSAFRASWKRYRWMVVLSTPRSVRILQILKALPKKSAFLSWRSSSRLPRGVIFFSPVCTASIILAGAVGILPVFAQEQRECP